MKFTIHNGLLCGGVALCSVCLLLGKKNPEDGYLKTTAIFFFWQRGCLKNLHFEQGTGVADGE